MPRPFHSRPHRVNEFPARAFFLFSVALAASAWALFADFGRPFLPSVPIVLYTLFLYVNRTAVGQQESDALKDSPYFLGFLLTMFGLFKIFNDVSFNFALFGRNPELMTAEVGGAVLTTIVGLFSRQALYGLVRDESPAEDDRLTSLANAVTSHAVAFEMARQQFFREMADERTKQSRELESTQERFLARLDELTRSVPIIGGPPVHAEAGYTLAERPGAIVVGATPRPTVGFNASVPTPARGGESLTTESIGRKPHASATASTWFVGETDSIAPNTASPGDVAPPVKASTVIEAGPAFPVDVVASVDLAATARIQSVEIAALRSFEPVAALVTPPPSSGRTAADWVVATSRPDIPLTARPTSQSAASQATPSHQSTVPTSVEEPRVDRSSRSNSAIAAPYVRPTRGTPGYGDVS